MIKLLTISRGTQNGCPEGHQAQAYYLYQRALRKKQIELCNHNAFTTDEVVDIARRCPSDAMILMFSWGDPESAILTALDKIRDSTTSKLIFLDYYAPTASPHFQVASKVDVYLKRQTLRNESLYDQDFVGGYIFTDFLAKQMG
jgi:hypothetical protein